MHFDIRMGRGGARGVCRWGATPLLRGEEGPANFYRMKKMLLGFTLVAALGCKSNSPAAPTPVAPTTAVAVPTGAKPPEAEPALFAVGTKMKCAVTGEDFTVSPKTTQIVYEGKRYAFCCGDCLPEFNKNPAKFAKN